MTTFTIYAGTNDGLIQSSSATYATARSGGGALSASTSGGGLLVGQQFISPNNYCFEAFLDFDTSVIGAGANVSAATLSLDGENNASDTDFTAEAYSRDWGSTLTTGDFVAGASIGGLTLLASMSSPGYSGSYNDFTSEAGFPAAINVTGNTRIMVASSRHRGNIAPAGDEYISFASADSSGTSKDPKLTVVATLPISGTLTKTEANDTVSATGTIAIAGAAAITEANDTVGSIIYTASPGQIQVKHAGAWQVPTPWVKHNDTWKQPIAGYVNSAGTWKRVL